MGLHASYYPISLNTLNNFIILTDLRDFYNKVSASKMAVLIGIG